LVQARVVSQCSFTEARWTEDGIMASLVLLSDMYALVLSFLAVFGTCESINLARIRQPDVVAWTPPPEYGAKTAGHKTMYLADIAIGSSGEVFRVLVDTGSSVLVVPGKACSSEACSKHRRFDGSKSNDTQRTLSIQFGLGSLKGRLLSDTVCVQASGSDSAPLEEIGFLQRSALSTSLHARAGFRQQTRADNSCTKLTFLVAEEVSDDLASEPYDGILGLGLQDPSMTGGGFSLLDELANAGSISSSMFALQLSGGGRSQLEFGSVDESSLAGGRALWVPLSPVSGAYWQFSISDLSVGGQAQHFGELEVLVDSGTSLLAADDDLKHWMEENLQPKDCAAVDHLPKLELQLSGGSSLSLLPSDYIDQTDGECKLALMPGQFPAVNGQRLVLGDSFLRRYVTIFDRKDRRLGFGVQADDSLAHELLPGMFPAPTTTAAPQTTQGPPPEMNVTYSDYEPVSTKPPPTPEDLEVASRQQELSTAFSKMPDDLAGSFESNIAQQKASLGIESASAPSSSAAGAAARTHSDSSAAGSSGDVTDAGNAYMSYLNLLQRTSLLLSNDRARGTT